MRMPKRPKPSRKLLLIGVGDLGSRIVQLAAHARVATQIHLLSRSPAVANLAHILSVAADVRITSAAVDALEAEALEREIARFEPDLIIQSASLLSPWALMQCRGAAGQAIAGAGFALQVAAQLPVVANLMRVLAVLGSRFPVINCSFPDVTHAMLHSVGLAPDVGIGNVAMIAAKVRQMSRPVSSPLRVIAHHGHVSRCLQNRMFDDAEPEPLVYEGQKRLRWEECLRNGSPPLLPGVYLNHLSAVTAMPIIQGLLGERASVRTHAPGVAGRLGGYPVRIEQGRLALDLPRGVPEQTALDLNRSAARLDGVEEIRADGTLIYTDRVRRLCKGLCNELSEPLHVHDALKRWRVLESFVKEER